MSHITREPIDSVALLGRVAGPSKGGLVLFVGTVRDHAEGRTNVTAIDYDAHEALADKTLCAVLDETRERFPGVDVAAVHRIGYVALGEASVAVAAGAAHRSDAFAAARHAIDALKARVPIWKKELSPDGDEWLHGDDRIPVAPGGPDPDA